MANPSQKKEPGRGSYVVVGLLALSGAVLAGRLLFVRHDPAPSALAPGAPLEENAWVTVSGHVDTERLGRVTRLGSDLYAFPLTEQGPRLLVLVEEKEFPALADAALWKPDLLARVLKEKPPEVKPETIAFLEE